MSKNQLKSFTKSIEECKNNIPGFLGELNNLQEFTDEELKNIESKYQNLQEAIKLYNEKLASMKQNLPEIVNKALAKYPTEKEYETNKNSAEFFDLKYTKELSRMSKNRTKLKKLVSQKTAELNAAKMEANKKDKKDIAALEKELQSLQKQLNQLKDLNKKKKAELLNISGMLAPETFSNAVWNNKNDKNTGIVGSLKTCRQKLGSTINITKEIAENEKYEEIKDKKSKKQQLKEKNKELKNTIFKNCKDIINIIQSYEKGVDESYKKILIMVNFKPKN